MNALATVSAATLSKFDEQYGKEFSKFKYGDPDSIRYFAEQVADVIWRQHGTHLSHDSQDFRIAFPAYRNAPTAAVLLAERVQSLLRDKWGADVKEIHLNRVELSSGDFGALRSREAREQQIFGNFYYRGPSLDGKTILFIEDALVSGTHYQETQRVLESDAKVELENIHGYFIADVDGESFGNDQFSVEAVLNHLWVSPQEADRLLEILLKPNVQVSPRMVKMLLDLPFDKSREILDQLDAPVVLSVYHSTRSERMEEKPRYSESALLLKSYADERLEQVKELLNVDSAFHVSEDTMQRFMVEPVVRHPLLNRQLSHGEMYSLLKFGDAFSVEFCARNLAETITARFSDRLRDGSWGIAAPGYAAAPGSARLLATRCAELLHLPIVQMNRTDVPQASYGKISDARIRIAEVAAAEYEIQGPRCPNLIVIEDAIVSGANTARQCKLLKSLGSETYPFSLIDVASCNLDLEERLNSAIISSGDAEQIAAVISDPHAVIVMRTVKTLLTIPSDRLSALLISVPPKIPLERCVEIFNIARLNDMAGKPAFRDGFQVLARHTIPKIVARKGVALPPYEPMLLVTADNTENFLSDVGQSYSALKYGDRKACEHFAHLLASAIRDTFGAALTENPERFVIAATHIYRVPNAASHLASLVASTLGLEMADVRRKSIFEGEFGAIADRETRKKFIEGNAFVSNSRSVQNREVIYIDDAVVAGTHLLEHHRALYEAGASSIATFSVLDVTGERLSLEKDLNHALVRPDNVSAALTILSDPRAPILTRTLKLLLKQPSDCFERSLEEISDDRVFDLCESATVEGYSKIDSMRKNFARLHAEAQHRHENTLEKVPSNLYERRYSMMIFDYDETLSPTLTPLPDEMMRNLTYFLKHGVTLGIVSLQPIGSRGLRDNFLTPMQRYLNQTGEDLRLLRRVRFLPSEGIVGFRTARDGSLNEDQPLYNVGFQASQEQEFERRVLGSEAGRMAIRTFLRGGYISLHFASKVECIKARDILNCELDSFFPPVTTLVKKTSDNTKHVLHIKLADASKAIGREYMLRSVRDDVQRRLGRPIPRHEILVAGDKMGVSDGEADDAAMFVHGGVNLALGSEACRGAYDHLLGMRSAGLCNFLTRVRQFQQSTAIHAANKRLKPRNDP